MLAYMPVGLILVVTGVIILVGVVLLSFGLYYFIRDKRLMSTPNTPIGKLRDGEVAVRGIVRSDPLTELRTPVGNYPCVWYHTRLDFYRNPHGPPGYSWLREFVKIYERTEGEEFVLSDKTGSVLIKLHDAKPVLSTKVERTITKGRWPDGFTHFNIVNRLGIDLDKRLDNSYHFLQEYIPPGMDLKVKGVAHRPIGKRSIRSGPETEFIIERSSILPESYLMTDTKEGRVTREGKFRFLTFSIVGGAITGFGILLMITSLLKYA